MCELNSSEPTVRELQGRRDPPVVFCNLFLSLVGLNFLIIQYACAYNSHVHLYYFSERQMLKSNPVGRHVTSFYCFQLNLFLF